MLQEGRLTGRRCVISNFLDSKGVAEKFSSSAERQVRCKFSDCIREAWATVASHVRSMTRRSQHAGSINTVNQRMVIAVMSVSESPLRPAPSGPNLCSTKDCVRAKR